jgi:GLPGLI family protein
MKYSIIILTTLIFLNQKVFGQTSKYDYVISYGYTFQNDKTDVNSMDYEDMILLINDKKSYFMSRTAFQKDTMAQKNKQPLSITEALEMRKKFPKVRVKFEIEKSKSENNYAYYEKIYTTTYRSKYKNDAIVWKLVNEKKDIAGYNCRRAETKFAGRNYTAWYSEEIPMSDGPYKFQGLPGLILEVTDEKKQHSFIMKGLEKKLIEYTPSNKNIVDADMKEISIGRANQLNSVKNSGFSISPELMQAAKEKNGKNNNHIEIIN